MSFWNSIFDGLGTGQQMGTPEQLKQYSALDDWERMQREYDRQRQLMNMSAAEHMAEKMRLLELEQQRLIHQQQIYQAHIEANNLAQTAESKIKDKVKKALDDLDVYYTMPFTAGYGNSGVPDILACIEGRFFGIECKAGKNTTTALQDKHLNDIRAAGGVSLVINEANVDNVKALILANIGASNK